MKVNILFTIEDMIGRRLQAGKAAPDLHVRATGRSTGMALEAIGYAMQQDNQGRVLNVRVDHYQKPTAPVGPIGPRAFMYSRSEREAQSRQMAMMQGLVDKLCLKGFTFDKANLTYSYQVIYEV